MDADALKNLTPQQQSEIMQQVQQQVALANMQVRLHERKVSCRGTIVVVGAAPEGDRQMFQEMHHKSRLQSWQLGSEVCVPVHGQVHGLLQPGVQSLHQEAAADEMSTIACQCLCYLSQSAWDTFSHCHCVSVSCHATFASLDHLSQLFTHL